MRKFLAVSLLVASVALMGCAALKQAGEDYKTGVSAPLEEGEESPKDTARGITDLIAPIPYVGTAAPVLLPVLTVFFAWKRGRRIRKQLPPHPNPITGAWGKKIGLESIVQALTNTVVGITEVGKDGSGWKRAWKVGLAVLTGLSGAAFASPEVQQFLLAHPDIIATVTGLSAAFAGLEKEMQKVQPLPPTP